MKYGGLLIGIVVGALMTASFADAQGPYSAQIQRALANFAASTQSVTGTWTLTSPVITTPTLSISAVAISGLATCNAGANGRISFVTDSNAPALGAIVAAGGSTLVGVRCDGTNWRVI